MLGGEDFAILNKNIKVPSGTSRRCLAVVIFEDNFPEEDEVFELRVEELGISTSITILDDDGKN